MKNLYLSLYFSFFPEKEGQAAIKQKKKCCYNRIYIWIPNHTKRVNQPNVHYTKIEL